LFSIRTV